MKNLSVIGLGKLGSCTAACFAAKGFNVIGLDVNEAFVAAINRGEAPVVEPQLVEMIAASGSRLTATTDFKQVIEETDVSFLIVPTPSLDDGHFSNAYVKEALTKMAIALKASSKPDHLFVITSTVSPGSCDREFIPLIESISGRKLNQGFSMAYNPEFIALGSVIHDFLNTDLTLIGQSEPKAGQILEDIYNQVCESDHHVARMSLVSAELTKLSLNAYVTMKISFANTLANLCERIDGADVDDVTQALGADKRISPRYLKGGISFGGPCFPRDNRALSAFAETLGLNAHLAQAVDKVNEYQIQHLAELVSQQIDSGQQTVAIVGLAYKPCTPVITESPGIQLAQYLLQHYPQVELTVFDPLAMENAKAVLPEQVCFTSSFEDCLGAASNIIITTPDPHFRVLPTLLENKPPITLIDCWRLFDAASLPSETRYICIGKPAQAQRQEHVLDLAE